MANSTNVGIIEEDFFRATSGDMLPDGINDVTEGVYHDGVVHVGNANLSNARFSHLGIVSYSSIGAFATQTIQTNIPASSVLMSTIFIKGYAYESAHTIDLQMSLYTYNLPSNSLISPVWSSKGSTKPSQVRMAYVGGFLAIEFTWDVSNDYYQRWEVSAYCDGPNSHTDAMFEGWTVTTTTIDPSATTITIVPDKTHLVSPHLIEGTRAQINSWAAANILIPGVFYRATDINWVDAETGQEWFTAVAVSSKLVSGSGQWEGATINPTLPFEASMNWSTGQLTHIYDSINRNEVRGITSTQTFPFGNLLVWGNEVSNSGIIIFNGIQMIQNTISSTSSLTIPAGVTFNYNNIENGTITFLGGGTPTFSQNRVKSSTVIIGSGSPNIQTNEFLNRSNSSINQGSFLDNIVNSDATVTVSTGYSNVCYKNVFEVFSTVNILAGGNFFERNKISTNSTVNYSSANYFSFNEVSGASTVTVAASSNFQRNIVTTNSNFNGTDGTFLYNVLENSCNVTHTGGSIGDCTITRDSSINISNGTYDNNLFDGVTYNQTIDSVVTNNKFYSSSITNNSPVTLINNIISNSSTVTLNNITVGAISNSFISRGYLVISNCNNLQIIESTITNYGTINVVTVTNNLYLFRSTLSEQGRFAINAAATNSSIFCNYSKIIGGSYIQNTIVAGGTTYFNYGTLDNSSFIINETSSFFYSEHDNINSVSSIIVTNGSSNCRTSRLSLSNNSNVQFTANSTGCQVYWCNLSAYSYINCNNSTGARIYYNSCTGSTNITSSGNTNIHYIYYCSTSGAGNISMINNTSTNTRIYGVTTSGQSIATLQDSTGTDVNLYYSSFSAYYYLYLTLSDNLNREGMFGMGRRTRTGTNLNIIAPYAIGGSWQNI